MYFNSRPHEEVDKFLIANAEKKKGFQLTTSRRGRRGIAPMWKAHDSVSTHDLTKRSTHRGYLAATCTTFQLTTSRRGRHIRSFLCILSRAVSTHDLTKRSTKASSRIANGEFMFQLTTSRRGRHRHEQLHPDVWIVSTHDLTKRSTRHDREHRQGREVSTHDLTKRSTAIFTQKVFLSKSLFVLIAYNIFILH